MLNIGTLTTRWGKIFGGINEINTFRGITLPNRADAVAAQYTTAAQQRIVVDDLYQQTQIAKDALTVIYQDYVQMAKDTLAQMCKDDSTPPVDFTDTTCLQKLINDMVAQNETFKKPTVTIGGSGTFANATEVNTVLGLPKGNGVIVGTIIEPRTGQPRPYPFVETLNFVCEQDSYTNGAAVGNESFRVTGAIGLDPDNPLWPVGSGTDRDYTADTSETSALITNAYFDNWDTTSTDTILDWTMSNLTPGTTITRSAQSYAGPYAVQLTGAIVNAELKQTVGGLTGATNYVCGLRVRRLTGLSAGVITVALRSDAGTTLFDASGVPLSFTIPLTGAAGAYFLTSACFAVSRSFPGTVQASIKITTAMNAGESVLLDTFELMPMQPTYVGGPDLSFLPGSIPWANGDTYTLALTNTATVTTFVRDIDRIYDIKSIPLDLPLATPGTVPDTLIS